MLRDRLRIFNKYVINRVLRVFSHLSHGPFAIIGHAGRRSGKSYETVIMVWPMEESFVIALTYGSQVDWLRNLLAAGGGQSSGIKSSMRSANRNRLMLKPPC